MKRKILALLGTLALVAVLLVPGVALADGQDTAGGEFTTNNNAPTVAAPLLFLSNEETSAGGSMDPQTEYAVKVVVTDIDGIESVPTELVTVKVTLMYDNDNDWGTSGEPGTQDTGSSNIPTTGNVNYVGILTCSSAGIDDETINTTPADYFTIDAGADTSWTVEAASCHVIDDSTTQRTFWFHFKPGAVACEAAPTSDCWHIYAEATDNEPATGANQLTCQAMTFYSQVVITDVTVDFGKITLGGAWVDEANEVTLSGIQWIANGSWAGKVKNSGDWTGTTWTATFLTSGDPASAQDFALKAWATDAVGSAIQVTTGFLATNDTGGMTAESPDAVTTETLWLLAHSTFAQDTYGGTITYINSNAL